MLEYGSLPEFARAVQQQFRHLSQFTTRKEVADILSPKIKELVTTLDCIGKYHRRPIVDELVLNDNLNLTIAKCLPSEFNISYSNKIAKYHALNPRTCAPA